MGKTRTEEELVACDIITIVEEGAVAESREMLIKTKEACDAPDAQERGTSILEAQREDEDSRRRDERTSQQDTRAEGQKEIPCAKVTTEGSDIVNGAEIGVQSAAVTVSYQEGGAHEVDIAANINKAIPEAGELEGAKGQGAHGLQTEGYVENLLDVTMELASLDLVENGMVCHPQCERNARIPETQFYSYMGGNEDTYLPVLARLD